MMTVKLSKEEVDLLLYALSGYSARVKREAAEGRRDEAKAKALTDDLCAISSKLYQIEIAYLMAKEC